MLHDKARNDGRHVSAVGQASQQTWIWRSPGVRVILWLVIALEFAAIFHLSASC